MSRPVSTKVLRWVIICGYTVLVRNQQLRQTRTPAHSRMVISYCKRVVAVLRSWEGSRRSGIALEMSILPRLL